MNVFNLLERLGFPGNLYALQNMLTGKIGLKEFFDKINKILDYCQTGADPETLPEFQELKKLKGTV